MSWYMPLVPITLLGLFSILAALFYLRKASRMLASRRRSTPPQPTAAPESPLHAPR
jgi:hypothetical protein